MDALIKTFKKFGTFSLIIVVSLVVVDVYVWFILFSQTGFRTAHEYVLDVGQGDSELVILPSNVKIMTDAGPATKSPATVIGSLQKVLPQGDRYIDVAIISHPDSDHFAGYIDILDHYDVSAFIYNGRNGDSDAWRTLMEKIAAKNIPLITLGMDDNLHYGNNSIDILSPNAMFDQSAETNDTSIVEMITVNTGSKDEFKSLFTGDAPFDVEDYLLKNNVPLRADVLKVAHHGSKYASGNAFLRAVNPSVAAIGVGAKNIYGHPSKEALARIASSTHAVVFRTDLNGTVEIFSEGGILKIAMEKMPEGKSAPTSSMPTASAP